jgi:hypothetical protein
VTPLTPLANSGHSGCTVRLLHYLPGLVKFSDAGKHSLVSSGGSGEPAMFQALLTALR